MKIFPKTLMALPGPSFLKILQERIIVGLLTVFFILGGVKSGFAAYPGECSRVFYSIDFSYTSIKWTYSGWSIADDGKILKNGWACLDNVHWYAVTVMSFYFENGSWYYLGQGSGFYRSFGEGIQYTDIRPNPFDYPCENSCTKERQALETACGGPDLYVIDEETCKGKCSYALQSAGSPDQCEN